VLHLFFRVLLLLVFVPQVAIVSRPLRSDAFAASQVCTRHRVCWSWLSLCAYYLLQWLPRSYIKLVLPFLIVISCPKSVSPCLHAPSTHIRFVLSKRKADTVRIHTASVRLGCTFFISFLFVPRYTHVSYLPFSLCPRGRPIVTLLEM
jgi:hypothetical protein